MYMLLNFSTQWNSIERSGVGRQHLNRALDFLFTFTLIANITRVLAIRKFRAGYLGLLSINFDFQNVILQPMVASFVWAKYKWKLKRSFQALLPSAPRGFAARSRVLSHKTKIGELARRLWKAFLVYRERILFFVWTKCFVKFFSRSKIRSCEELRFSSHFSFSLFPFPVPYFTNIPTNQRPTKKRTRFHPRGHHLCKCLWSKRKRLQ